MRKRRFISLWLCLALLLCLACPAVADETTAPETTVPETLEPQTAPLNTDASVASGCRTLDAQVPLRSDKILETGKSGLLYEVNSGTLLYAENIDVSVSPGSFVKLMTALLAVELGNPEDTIIVSQQTLDRVPENSSITGFLAGEEVTMEQLLYSLILDSANDAAVIIAEHISGSQDAFIAAMNQKAAELGCTGTNYTNVHGIQDDQQYTTARDLAKIMAYALQDDWFKNVISTEQYYMSETNMMSEQRRMDTDNYMMSQIIDKNYYDYRVTGGKTATNVDGEKSVIVTAENAGLYYIGIVLDAKPELTSDGTVKLHRQFTQMGAILDLGFDNYEVKQILYEGQITGRFTVINGENSVAVGPTKSVMSVLPSNVNLNELTLQFQRTGGTLNAPVVKGQTLDILQVWYGSVCIAQSELVAMNSSAVAAAVPETTTGQGLDTAGLTKALAVLGIILVIILGFVAILYIIRIVRRAAFQAKRRRRRNSRRRSR